jgi:dTDP-4-amino-4,6-dideoxygalactose transaminase
VAILCGLEPGDEVVMPSYTFVSTANAVVLRGAIPEFIDIRPDTLNLDERRLIEAAVTEAPKQFLSSTTPASAARWTKLSRLASGTSYSWSRTLPRRC